MGRPTASDVSRTVASLFANVVTVPSNIPNDWVARTGDHSIFNVLSHLIPKVNVQFIVFMCDSSMFDEHRFGRYVESTGTRI